MIISYGRVLTLAACTACAVSMAAIPTLGFAGIPTTSVDPNSGIRLTPRQLAERQKLALRGDDASTRAVIRHYVLGLSDFESAEQWMRLSASRGEESEMLNLAEQLPSTRGVGGCRESMFWLRVASNSTSKKVRQSADAMRTRLKARYCVHYMDG